MYIQQLEWNYNVCFSTDSNDYGTTQSEIRCTRILTHKQIASTIHYSMKLSIKIIP